MSTEIKGIEQIQKALNNLSKITTPGEMKTTMNTIGNMVRNTIEESFENQADPWGKKWESLSAKTQKAKKGKGKILRASGNLEDKWYITASSSSVEVSNNLKSKKGYSYGPVHQWGSDKRNIPARPFLPIDDDGNLKKELGEDILKVIEKKIQKAIEG